ncbi:MAG: hypothetical protein KAY59_07835, partial [Acidobacteria bacterium]|nr:hypothetical protein [Acidobacteriota bacterium]
QVTMTSNVVGFTWSGSGSTYKMIIGSAAGASDILSADVTGTSYTWTGPRTAGIYYARVAATTSGTVGSASTELPVFTLDMRNMIDALYYNTGPLSQFPTVAPNNNVGAGVFADGSSLTLLVTNESTAASLTNAQQFVSEYLAAAGNPFTVGISATSADYKNVSFAALPQFTIVIRVLQDYCSSGAIACAQLGPSPIGSNKSFVTMNQSTGAVSIAHEIGHAFGMYHMAVTSSARVEFRFLMNPALVASQLSAVEKATIAAARAGGLRQGTTRAQALGLNLVLPFTGTASALAAAMPRVLDDIKSVFIGS